MIEEETRKSKPTAIELLIDCSGSMRGEPLTDAKNACRKLISEVVDLNTNEVGITSFANETKDICEMTSDKDTLIASVDNMEAWGGTEMMNGIENSYKKILKSKKADKIIFLMTDGAPNSGDHSEIVSEKMRKENNVRLAVIFIRNSNSRGYNIAQNVARANTLVGESPLFYTSSSMSELGAIFKKVYTDITNVN